ncbi:MAG TPA: ATP-binding protein [Pirellulales bacterium]|nr:ATP-binding protein [Pirellulales bacterium]
MRNGLNTLLTQADGQAAAPPAAAKACSFCAIEAPPGRRVDAGDVSLCGDCLAACARAAVGLPHPPTQAAPPKAPTALERIESHFVGQRLHELVTHARTFPSRMRADVQVALDNVLGTLESGATLMGVLRRYGHETLELASIITHNEHDPVNVAPLQYIEVDIGEDAARRCLKTSLWLCRHESIPYAVLLSPAVRYGENQGLHIEVALPNSGAASIVAERLFSQIEHAVHDAQSYRGKVLSLERGENYRGRSTTIKVHRLRNVSREEVILPERSLALLERNVFEFNACRGDLRRWGLSTKKGLLFHGPPGTGKTHTIQYLASRLAGHTTLLITAEQIGLFSDYIALARLLQPSVVVIEDADLIARERSMDEPCAEVLLNKLLNEMDGLREDAEILFILTTNRPATLEPALAARPGRVDQAIEFPLPDLDGRRKLLRLYARGLKLDETQFDDVARRTKGTSPAFIKELMRRTAQNVFQRDPAGKVNRQDIDAALDEMLFKGGQLNVAILGGCVENDGGGEEE